MDKYWIQVRFETKNGSAIPMDVATRIDTTYHVLHGSAMPPNTSVLTAVADIEATSAKEAEILAASQATDVLGDTGVPFTVRTQVLDGSQ